MTQVLGVRFRRGDKVYPVYPVEEAASIGVYIAKGQVDGIYDAPVKTTWKSSAFQDGSTQKAVKRLQRDMNLGFHVTETVSSSYDFNESEFRRIFFYELDRHEEVPTVTTLEVETDISGTRKLDVLMYDTPEFKSDLDPISQEYGNLILKLRAGQPMWYEDVIISESTGGHVTVENPTDNYMFQEWVLDPGTYSVPDYSWIGGPNERVPGGGFGDRTISVTITAEDGVSVISLNPLELQIRDEADNNILARMGGKAFAFTIPPYTPATALPIATGAELRMHRRWSRPWGLEWHDG